MVALKNQGIVAACSSKRKERIEAGKGGERGEVCGGTILSCSLFALALPLSPQPQTQICSGLERGGQTPVPHLLSLYFKI